MAAGSSVCVCIQEAGVFSSKETIYVQLVEHILEKDYTKQKTQMKQNETHHQKVNGLENER